MIIIPIVVSQEELDAYNRFIWEGFEEFPWLVFLITSLVCGVAWCFLTPYAFSMVKIVLCLLAGGMTTSGLMIVWGLFKDIMDAFKIKELIWRIKKC